MNLRTLYKQSLLYPTIAVVLLAITYTLAVYLLTEQHEGEHMYSWYDRVIINVIAAIMFSAIVSVFSLPIFLNLNIGFSSKKYRAVLSWFLLPYGFMLAVLGKAINEALTVNSYWEIIYTVLASTPFVIGLQRGFSRFTSRLPHNQQSHIS